jgi:hypothetical protein
VLSRPLELARNKSSGRSFLETLPQLGPPRSRGAFF